MIDDCTQQGWTVIGLEQVSQCCAPWSCALNSQFKNKNSTFISKSFLLNPHYKISVTGIFYIYYNSPFPGGISIYCDNKLLNYQCSRTSISLGPCTSNSLTILIYVNYEYWVVESLQLTVYSCNPGCQFCEFSGECLYFFRFLDLNNNPLTSIEGWTQNGIPYQNSYYNIIGVSLQILGLESGLSVGNLFEKQIPIIMKGQFRISFKAVTRNLLAYKIQIFINQLFIEEKYSSGNVINFNCPEYVFQIQQFQLYSQNVESQMTIGIIYQYQAVQCLGHEDQIYFGIRDLGIFYNNQEICEDNNFMPFDGCYQQMYSCVEGCKECLEGKCLECIEGFQYIQSTKFCIPICGDAIIQLNEECDDGNEFPYDGCFNCKFSCPINCTICEFGICHQVIVKENHDSIANFIELGFTQDQLINDNNYRYYIQLKNIQCQFFDYTLMGYQYQVCQVSQIQWCHVNYFQTCFECFEGYELDFNKQFCKAKCNDGYLEEFEQCDDKNNIQFDGCYKCQNNCQKECQVCERSKCLKCFDGWNLNSGSCYQICGDGLLAIESYEQCDDGNDISEDGCFQCKIECSSNCASCSSNQTCEICEDFYILKNNYCYPHCGDKIVVDELEECDDGNDIEFDGCHNCRYSCPQVCIECEKGTCLKQCDYGYYLNNHNCQSYCGDLIIASNEECDDGNDVKFDGCYNCLYSCTIGCSECQNGKCFNCKEGYQLVNYQCADICGNEMRNINEECDDGNNVNGDGCDSNCKIEKEFSCISQPDSKTRCFQQPQLKLTYFGKSFGIQYVQVSFSKELKFLSKNYTFKELLYLTIIQLDSLSYNIEIIPITELSYNEFAQGQYQIKIQFLETMSDNLNLQVFFNNDLRLVDENNVFFDQTEIYSIILQPVYVLNQNQIQISQQFQSIGSFMIIGFGASALLLLFLGYFFQFFEILDILQYQVYFRYLNLIYPQNLYIYFQSSDSFTLEPILEFVKINIIYSFIIGEEYLESIYQFKIYEINADLFTNIYIQIVQFSLAIILIVLPFFYKKFYFRNCFSNKLFKYLKLRNQSIITKLALLIHKLNNHIFSIQNSLTSEGIKQLFLVNSWDLTFKVLLFIASNKKLGIREILSYTFCCAYFAYTIFYFITYYKKKIRKTDQANSRRDRHQVIILQKRILFLFFLIHLQTSPTLQGLLQVCIQGLYIGLIITIKLTENRLETKMILITEIPLLLFTISALSYSPDFIKYLSEENRVTLGFVQIGILVFGLAAPFIKQFNFFLQKSKQYIEERCCINERPKLPQFDQLFGICNNK